MLRRSAQLPRISDFSGTLGLAFTASLSGGALALLGLRVGYPLADELLHGADLALGFDGVSLSVALVHQGQWIFSIMAPAYAYTIPLLGLSICAHALAGHRLEACAPACASSGRC
jgi:hypothetical protein